MTTSFWHVRSDFLTAPPAQVLSQFWQDDELNRQRSLATFKDELALRILDWRINIERPYLHNDGENSPIG